MKYLYPFPDREIQKNSLWADIVNLTDSDPWMYTENETYSNPEGGYDDGVLIFRPYNWNDDKDTTPNFEYKPLGVKMVWYKYPFRDCHMNKDLSAYEVVSMFSEIVQHLRSQLGRYY